MSMVNRYELTKDILDLVDSDPLNNVDIGPIVQKYTAGLETEQQRVPRMAIRNILDELKTEGEVDFVHQSFSNLTTSMAGNFVGNSGMVRSTRKRQKERETKPKLNKIQLSTRRNILDSFMIAQIPWYGTLDQPTFLGRLYDLSSLPSYDTRFKTAGEDIQKHTVFNNDWPDEWVFTDARFNLLHASDDAFLDFLCMTIHPAVRLSNNEELTTLLEIYTNNLKRDGFTINRVGEIAGRPVFSPATINPLPSNQSSVITVSSDIKKALVIGCGAYIHAPTLVNPINDADDMDVILKKLGFEVAKINNPTQKELKIAIDEFGQGLKGSDIGLFYFAGHGVQVKGLNYLIPVDANLTSEKIVEYDCVEASRVLAHMAGARTSINIIVLDACRNNPFERNWARGIGQRGLAIMDAPKGSLIAYSTNPGNTASDGSGRNGLYTESLLSHISSKATTINTMFQKVRSEVMEKTNEEQVPWEATSLTADFYFNK